MTLQNPSHYLNTSFICLARFLERSSYYGFRAIVVLYMIDSFCQMDQRQALSVYGVFTSSLLLSYILGGIVGDLWTGHKKAIFLGGALQALGAFCLCYPSTVTLYLGISLITLGSGLYSPNLNSHFGKSFSNHQATLDSGFTLLYLMNQIGAFVGILSIVFIGEIFGYHIGFMLAGALILFSLIPIYYTTAPLAIDQESNTSKMSVKATRITIASVVVGLFLAISSLTDLPIRDIQLSMSEISIIGLANYNWHLHNFIQIVILGLAAIIYWSRIFSSTLRKITLGAVFAVVSFALLLSISDTLVTSHAVIFLLALIFLSLAEIHISPLLNSIATRYANQKYLATTISLVALPSRLFSILFAAFSINSSSNVALVFTTGLISMLLATAGLVVLLVITRRIESHLVN